MSEKSKLIAEMIEMQTMFTKYELKHGVDPAEFYTKDESHPLFGYPAKYQDLLDKVDVIAHSEKGSTRWFQS